MDISAITKIAAVVIYGALAAIALWGAFCVVMVWSRVTQKRFRSEEEQDEFMEALEEPLARGDFDEAAELLDGDRRAVCQLSLLAILNRKLGFTKVRQLVMDRFQRDVLADLEYRLSWVNTVIKSAPMVGLLGTVIGMMGAFAKLATAQNVQANELAENISLALITTACGLSIAIPLVLCVTMINVRIRKLEDLAATGLTRFLDAFRPAMKGGGKAAEPVRDADRGRAARPAMQDSATT